jgi:hypothetical protein
VYNTLSYTYVLLLVLKSYLIKERVCQITGTTDHMKQGSLLRNVVKSKYQCWSYRPYLMIFNSDDCCDDKIKQKLCVTNRNIKSQNIPNVKTEYSGILRIDRQRTKEESNETEEIRIHYNHKRLVRVGFLVDKVTMGEVFLRLLRFSLVSIITLMLRSRT